MTPEAIFEQYRREHRTQPLVGYTLEVLPMLSRYTSQIAGAKGFIVFTELPGGCVDATIDEQLDYFARQNQKFEWTVFDYDMPGDLKARLEARGFAAEHEEALMVVTVATWTRAPALPDGIRIVQLTDETGIRDFVSVQQQIWPDENLDWLFERYARELREVPLHTSLYCAYSESQPIATGRIDFPRSRFAQLYGGSVLPAFRGRGIFSAMVDHRIREAGARGYAFVTVDAAPMSRPILLKQGFQHVCFTYPMCLCE